MHIDWKSTVKNLVAYGIIAGALLVTFLFSSPTASYSAGSVPSVETSVEQAAQAPFTETQETLKAQAESVLLNTVNNASTEISTETIAPKLASEQLVNINHASSEELDTLPGIGPVKAAAIVAWRVENGLYKTVNDLLNVKGIGEKTLEKLTPLICCE